MDAKEMEAELAKAQEGEGTSMSRAFRRHALKLRRD